MARFGKRPVLFTLAAVLIAAGAWAAVDLWKPVSSSLRQFDPEEVARLETKMWRSYYAKQRLRLFNELAELMRRQYRLPFLRSYVVAYHGAKAAFVFKDGKNRADYEQALPDLLDYYSAIRAVSDTPFDVDRVSRLELEWWIVHRQRDSLPAGSLERALSELPAEIYTLPVSRFTEHSKYRAEAMLLRDRLAEKESVTEADWQQIDTMLRQSWRALWAAVNE